MLFVHFGIVSPAENEVHRRIVEVRKADKGLGGDIALAGFVIRICALSAVDFIRYLFLSQ